MLGIQHRPIQKHSPWQNGRIERFFGTLKRALRKAPLFQQDELRTRLNEFLYFYNQLRPHQALDGLTPDQFYYDQKNIQQPEEKWQLFEAWNGALRAFYPI